MVKNKKSSILYKFLLSFVTIFLLPFCTLGFFTYYSTVNSFQNRIETNKRLLTEQKTEELEEEFKNLGILGYQIASYDQMNLFYIEQSKELEISRDIMQLESSNSFVRNIYLYYPTVSRIYSSEGMTDARIFFERMFYADGLDVGIFDEILKNSGSMQIKRFENVLFKGSETANMILCIVPLSLWGNFDAGFALYLIDEQKILSIYDNLFVDCSGGLSIWYDGQLLAQSNPQGVDSQAAWQTADKRTKHVKCGGVKYYSIRETNALLGWEAQVLLAEKELYNGVKTTRRGIFGFLLVLSILGCAAAVYLSRHYYKPIKRIADILDVRLDNGEDEFSQIHKEAKQVIWHNKMLENRMELQKEIVQEQLYIKLLYGAKLDDENDRQLEEMLGVPMQHRSFFVLLFAMKNTIQEDSKPQLREAFLNKVHDYRNDQLFVTCLELVSEKQFVLIAAYSDERSVNEIAQEISVAFDLQQIADTVAAGLAYGSIFDIDKSFLEANTALGYLATGQEFICSFTPETATQNMENWHSFSQDKVLLQSILKGNYNVACEHLERTFDKLANENTSYLFKRCICFEMTNSILSVMRDMHIDVSYQKMSELIEFESVEKTKQLLYELIQRATEHVGHTREYENKALLENILQYIDENLSSNALSIQAVASQHGMSVSYLSKFFKERVGKTFTEHLTSLRIERAKELLLGSELLIRDIMEEVGYVDLPSFTRRFRMEVGVSPGQYRKQQKERDGKNNEEI